MDFRLQSELVTGVENSVLMPVILGVSECWFMERAQLLRCKVVLVNVRFNVVCIHTVSKILYSWLNILLLQIVLPVDPF